MTRTPEAGFGNTVYKTRRGAGPDGRARTEGKDKSVPVPPPYWVLSELFATLPLSATSSIYKLILTRWQRRDKYIGSKSFPGPGLLPWSNPGEEGAEKKRWSRAMNVLEALGFARTSEKEAGLTDLGLVAARSLCGHIQLTDCLVGLDFFLSKLGTDHEWLDIGSRGILAEGWLSGCLWPDAVLPEADRHFKGKRKKA